MGIFGTKGKFGFGAGKDDDFDDFEYYEIECPNCNDVIYLDAEMLCEEGMTCPNCGTELEFDFDLDCDCGCSDCEEEEE